MGDRIGCWLLVGVALLSSVVAQDKDESRAVAVRPIVDPGLIGTWWGTQHFYSFLRFEIGPAGDLKTFFDNEPATLPTSVYVLEAADGRWRVRSVRGKSYTHTGTYKLSAPNRLEWSPWEVLSTLKREGSNPSSATMPLGLEDVDSIPKLIGLLKSADPAHRAAAALRLALVASERPQGVFAAIPSLIGLLKDQSPDARSHAALALGKIGAAAREAASSLVEVLHDEHPYPRRSAVEALRQVCSDSAVLVPAFTGVLSDAHPGVRDAAAYELSQMGVAAAPAAIALAKALADQEPPWVISSATSALRNMGPEAASVAAPALAQTLLRNPNEWTRENAAELLSWLGPKAKDVVSLLINLLKDSSASKDRRLSAAKILGSIGPDATSAVPALSAVIDNRSERRKLRDAAREAREKIEDGPK